MANLHLLYCYCMFICDVCGTTCQGAVLIYVYKEKFTRRLKLCPQTPLVAADRQVVTRLHPSSDALLLFDLKGSACWNRRSIRFSVWQSA